jgi:hypothetical protein
MESSNDLRVVRWEEVFLKIGNLKRVPRMRSFFVKGL